MPRLTVFTNSRDGHHFRLPSCGLAAKFDVLEDAMSDREKFKNLLIMAAADGRMNEAELRMLSDRATEWGITDEEFEDMLRQAIDGRATLTIPTEDNERDEFLKDMIRMMAADGHTSDGEKKLIAVCSAVLGVTSDDLNRLIDEVIDE